MADITPDVIAAGHEVKAAMDRAHQAHPNSIALLRLCDRLSKLVELLRPVLPANDFDALGGGTPKSLDDSDE